MGNRSLHHRRQATCDTAAREKARRPPGRRKGVSRYTRSYGRRVTDSARADIEAKQTRRLRRARGAAPSAAAGRRAGARRSIGRRAGGRRRLDLRASARGTRRRRRTRGPLRRARRARPRVGAVDRDRLVSPAGHDPQGARPHLLEKGLPQTGRSARVDPRRRGGADCCFSTSRTTPRSISRFARRGSTPARRLSPRWSTRCCATSRAPRRKFSPRCDPFDDDTPHWLAQRWRATYGEETARKIARAHRDEPTLDISVKSDPEGWALRLERSRSADRLGAPWRRTRRSSNCPVTPTANGGCRTPPRRLPARLIGAAAGARVVDLCAAPGGKSAQLAAAGANVTAVDRSAERLKRLAANFEPAAARGRDRGRQRARLRGGAVRRDAARRALHRDRDDPPPPRRRLDQAPGRPGDARRAAEPAARQGDRADQAGRNHRLLHLLARAGGGRGRRSPRCCAAIPTCGAYRSRRPRSAASPSVSTRPAKCARCPAICQASEPRLSGLDGFFAARLQGAGRAERA